MNEADDFAAHAAKYADTAEDAERLVEMTLARRDWRLRRGHKVCSACSEPKPVADFGQDVTRPDGLRRWCRSCVSAYNRASRGE